MGLPVYNPNNYNNSNDNNSNDVDKCKSYKKPYPLYHRSRIYTTVYLIRVCQDCGYLETCHGPYVGEQWRHLFIHPDYGNSNN